MRIRPLGVTWKSNLSDSMKEMFHTSFSRNCAHIPIVWKMLPLSGKLISTFQIIDHLSLQCLYCCQIGWMSIIYIARLWQFGGPLGGESTIWVFALYFSQIRIIWAIKAIKALGGNSSSANFWLPAQILCKPNTRSRCNWEIKIVLLVKTIIWDPLSRRVLTAETFFSPSSFFSVGKNIPFQCWTMFTEHSGLECSFRKAGQLSASASQPVEPS